MLIKMLQIIVKLIGTLLVLLGIILIYDARLLTKKFFSFGDQNDATHRIKNIGIYHSYCWWINYIFCINIFLSENFAKIILE